MDKDIKLQSLPTMEQRLKSLDVKIDELDGEIVNLYKLFDTLRERTDKLRDEISDCENILNKNIVQLKAPGFFDTIISMLFGGALIIFLLKICHYYNII